MLVVGLNGSNEHIIIISRVIENKLLCSQQVAFIHPYNRFNSIHQFIRKFKSKSFHYFLCIFQTVLLMRKSRTKISQYISRKVPSIFLFLLRYSRGLSREALGVVQGWLEGLVHLLKNMQCMQNKNHDKKYLVFKEYKF